MVLFVLLLVFVAALLVFTRPSQKEARWLGARLKRDVARVVEWVSTSPFIVWLLNHKAWRTLCRDLRTLGAQELDDGVLSAKACFMALVIVGVLWFISGSLLVGVVGALVGFILAVSLARKKRQQERAAELRALPDAYRSLANSLSAGRSISQALFLSAEHCSKTIAKALRGASFELRCGASLEDAFAHMGIHLDQDTCAFLTSALLISKRTGAPLSGLLEDAARLLEDQQEYRALVATKTAQARLSSRVVMVMPVILLGLLALISPDFQQGLTTPIGIFSLLVAGMMDAAAIVLMRTMMRRVLR